MSCTKSGSSSTAATLARSPPGADLSLLADGPERTVELRQLGDRLVAGTGAGRGSLIALLRTRQSHIEVVPSTGFWEGGVAPTWAEDHGWDSFGAWVVLHVGEVATRCLDTAWGLLDGVAG